MGILTAVLAARLGLWGLLGGLALAFGGALIGTWWGKNQEASTVIVSNMVAAKPEVMRWVFLGHNDLMALAIRVQMEVAIAQCREGHPKGSTRR